MSFGSIDNVNAPIPSSPAPPVKSLCTVTATVDQVNGKSTVQTSAERPESSTVTKIGKRNCFWARHRRSDPSVRPAVAAQPSSSHAIPNGAASRMPSGPGRPPQMDSARVSSHPPPTNMPPPQMQPPVQPWNQYCVCLSS